MDPEKRIYGIETEYPVFIPVTTGAPEERMRYEELLDIKKYLPEGITHLGNWLQNGSKYYLDGRALEYATAETTSAKDVVTHNLAGLRIVANSLSQYNDDRGKEYKIYKRAINIGRHSVLSSGFWGSHHNISANGLKMEIDQHHLYPLALHQATMAIYSGAGAIDEGYGLYARFALEQRAPGLQKDFSQDSLYTHSLMNLRNEPHTKRPNMRRVHITSINPNWSPWAERMAMGTSALVLGLIEDGYRGEDLMVDRLGHNSKNPLTQIAKTVAYDTDMNATIQLSKRRTSAVEIQSVLLDHVLRRSTALTEENKWTIDQWGKVIEDTFDGPERIADRVTWAARYLDLENIRSENKTDWNDPDLIARDYSWDEIKSNGEANDLVKNLSLKDRPAEKEILRAISHPPQDTRAKVRGEAIMESSSGVIDWSKLTVSKRDGSGIWQNKHLHLDDPFDNGVV